MINNKAILAGLFFLGLLLVGNGMTGNYLLDFKQAMCDVDSDCLPNEVCCDFYDESYGVCDMQANCKSIESITQEEKGKISILKPKKLDASTFLTKSTSSFRTPASRGKDYSLIAGFVMIVLVVVVMFWGVEPKKS